MADTPGSLLDRLRCQPDPQSWQRFVDMYTPFIRACLRRHALQKSDVDDLVQEVMGVVIEKLPKFEHNGRTGAFRNWLRTIVIYQTRSFFRSANYRPSVGHGEFLKWLEQLEDSNNAISKQWDHDHNQHVTNHLLQAIEAEFEPSSLQAFRRVVIEGVKPEKAAKELSLSINAVYIAKHRIILRLQKEGQGLLD